MRRQRNMQQMKEQSKNPPDQTNEEETGSLPEKEFMVMIVKMIQKLEYRRNNKINDIKNSLQGINSRITVAEELISDLEDKRVEITTVEQNKEKRMKRIEDSLRDHWDNIKNTNI